MPVTGMLRKASRLPVVWLKRSVPASNEVGLALPMMEALIEFSMLNRNELPPVVALRSTIQSLMVPLRPVVIP